MKCRALPPGTRSAGRCASDQSIRSASWIGTGNNAFAPPNAPGSGTNIFGSKAYPSAGSAAITGAAGDYAGVNQVKRHTRPNPMKNQQGGIVTKETPIHVSNVAIWNPITLKADRIGFRKLDDGRKVRFYKSNKEVIGV